jgi:hypothetical protein
MSRTIPTRGSLSPNRKERWSRADKINLGVAIIAIIAAASPWVPNVYHYVTRPTVVISSPPANYTSGESGFSASGTSQHIPEDDDLWLMVRAPGAFWFPIEKLEINGEWSVPSHMICYRLGPDQQDLQVWMIPDTADGALINYMNEAHPTSPITQMPPGSVMETHRTIQVPKDVKISC